MGKFIRGYKKGISADFGLLQEDDVPKLVMEHIHSLTLGGRRGKDGNVSGAAWCCGDRGGPGGTAITTSAILTSTRYGNSDEVRPKNRCYLPIIKG